MTNKYINLVKYPYNIIHDYILLLIILLFLSLHAMNL